MLGPRIRKRKFSGRLSFGNIWKNKLLLVSGIAAICLFGVGPSKSFAVIGVFALLALILWGLAWQREDSRSIQLDFSVLLLGVLIDYVLVFSFFRIWLPSSKVAALAGMVSLSSSVFLLVLGLLGGTAAFGFICYFVAMFAEKVEKIFEVKINCNARGFMDRLKGHWLVCLSALAFFCLESQPSFSYYAGVILACVFVALCSERIWGMFMTCKGDPLLLRIIAALSALGMCLAGKRAFFDSLDHSATIGNLPYGMEILYSLSIVGAAAGLLFAFVFISIVLGYVWRKIKEIGTFKRISRLEWAVYVVAFILLVALSTGTFMQSQAFYGTSHSYDIIYTSDSPALLRGTADLYLSFAENDLRQPLFAVFAAPFTGWVYFIASVVSKAIPLSACIFYSLENAVQIALMVLAMVLIVDMMELKRGLRVCFFVLMCCCYSTLLSALMMEQYIVAFFWLVFALYVASYSKMRDAVAYCGATGTLLTSGIAFLAYCPQNEERGWKRRFLSMFETGCNAAVAFLFFLILFSRFDVVCNLPSKISSLSNFAGKSVSVIDKLYQYLAFVSNCFFSPDAGIDIATKAYASWQLAPSVGPNWIGVAIIALAAISVAVNRKEPIVRISGWWALFSFLILFVLGWGTAENGLILYTLYFSWAFCVLLFKLLTVISAKVRLKYLTQVVCAACCCILLLFNIPGICDMVSFAIAYYPA